MEFKKTTQENKEILCIVNIAKEYVKAGYKIGQAIDIAKKYIRESEQLKYEK